MQNSSEHIGHLLLKKISKQLTQEEDAQLRQWAEQSDEHRQQFQELMNRAQLQKEYHLYAEAERRAELLSSPELTSMHKSKGTVHPLRWWWAAAILLLLCGGTYFWLSSANNAPELATNNEALDATIQPGSNKAILTLSDGSNIVLDSMANGDIAHQGNASIVKSGNGEILYRLNGESKGDALMNTMRTPNGGQYQLVLPDGTKVWMNAASSITYPASFVGKERRISVTGEVYLEVAKNANQPFRVDIKETAIEVLGTSFNVNAYPEDAVATTTLIEGKVKILAAGKAAILQPGQQALHANASKTIVIKTDANMEQIMAWKNGLFSFKDADLRSVMKQLERWYDITVRYEGQVPALTLNGEMYRNASLEHVLAFLQRMGVKLRMEGKTLMVI